MRRPERELEGKFEDALGLLGPTGRRLLALAAVRLGGDRGQGGERPAVALFGLRGEPAIFLEVELPVDVLERVTASDLADVLAEQVLCDARRFAEPRERRDAERLRRDGGGTVAGARATGFRSLEEVLALGAGAPPFSVASISVVSDRALPGEGLLEYLWHTGSIARGRARLAKRATVEGGADDV